jgi:hypothetical protein
MASAIQIESRPAPLAVLSQRVFPYMQSQSGLKKCSDVRRRREGNASDRFSAPSLRHPRLRLWRNQCGNKRSRLFNKSCPRSGGCPFLS